MADPEVLDRGGGVEQGLEHQRGRVWRRCAKIANYMQKRFKYGAYFVTILYIIILLTIA